jgi:hypothetical protein
MMTLLRSTAFTAILALIPQIMAGAASAEPVKVGDTMEGVRNERYCEIIPVVRDGLHLIATVYNTLGHNDCPAKVWDGITEDAMKERFGALMVLMNGPRYFIMDEISASGASASGVPDADIVAGAKGTATVVQDDLDNTYQKLD